MYFELEYEDKVATFKMPDIEQIRENIEDQFRYGNRIIANKLLLEKLYVEGDKIFFENEDYLYELEGELDNIIEEELGTSRYNDNNDSITVFFDDETSIELKKPFFKDTREFQNALNKMEFLKLRIFERVNNVNLLVADPKKVILLSLHFAALVNTNKISLKKKSKI